MKTYIELNTGLRTKATTEFEKDFYKLMNNSVFGKSMENLRKRKKVDLVQPKTNPKKYRKLTSDPAFKSRKIFSENLMAVHRQKTEIKLDRPTYIGFSVLELSKLCMYQFYYDVLKNRYENNCRLCYTDTDSLIVEIGTNNVYADMIEMADHFDFNDYPKDHAIRKALGDERVLVNKKIPGKFKDELSVTIMSEFIGLRPKMYSVLRAGENPNTANPKPEGFKESIRKAKGVPKSIVKEEFHHQRYKSVLFEKKLDDTIN